MAMFYSIYIIHVSKIKVIYITFIFGMSRNDQTLRQKNLGKWGKNANGKKENGKRMPVGKIGKWEEDDRRK